MWEAISFNSDRLKIPSGWIVRSWKDSNLEHLLAVAIHQVIVDDPEHTWVLENPPKGR